MDNTPTHTFTLALTDREAAILVTALQTMQSDASKYGYTQLAIDTDVLMHKLPDDVWPMEE